MEVLLVYDCIFFRNICEEAGRNLQAHCHQSYLNSAMPWSPSLLETQKVRDLLKGTERGKRSRKGSRKEGTGPKLWKETGQGGGEVESFCFPGPWFSSFSLRKADLVQWLGKQMPFIGKSNRIGQSSPICPGSHLPSLGNW